MYYRGISFSCAALVYTVGLPCRPYGEEAEKTLKPDYTQAPKDSETMTKWKQAVGGA